MAGDRRATGAFEAGKEVADKMLQNRWTDWTPFTFPFNLTQQPAASIPCGLTKAGLPVGTGRLVIDLSSTRSIDSAGLGALMLIQRMAAERRQTVLLRRPSEEIRFLLVLTKLAELFHFDDED